MAEGRPPNGNSFSFLRSFGRSLEMIVDNSIPGKTIEGNSSLQELE